MVNKKTNRKSGLSHYVVFLPYWWGILVSRVLIINRNSEYYSGCSSPNANI